jgi:hypothetical protein
MGRAMTWPAPMMDISGRLRGDEGPGDCDAEGTAGGTGQHRMGTSSVLAAAGKRLRWGTRRHGLARRSVVVGGRGWRGGGGGEVVVVMAVVSWRVDVDSGGPDACATPSRCRCRNGLMALAGTARLQRY